MQEGGEKYNTTEKYFGKKKKPAEPFGGERFRGLIWFMGVLGDSDGKL